jgi:hypothetical protein
MKNTLLKLSCVFMVSLMFTPLMNYVMSQQCRLVVGDLIIINAFYDIGVSSLSAQTFVRTVDPCFSYSFHFIVLLFNELNLSAGSL